MMYYLEEDIQGLHIQVHQSLAVEEDERRCHIHRNLPPPKATCLIN